MQGYGGGCMLPYDLGMGGRATRRDMDGHEALRVLGLEPGASWPEIRRAYRDRIRAAHPDLDRRGDATARAAALNEAFAVLDETTASGRRPLPPAPPAPESSNSPEPFVVLRAPAGDVFVLLLEAAHEVGDVCYVDPEAGLIQVLLGDAGPASSQLLISVDVERDPPAATFTLDSMDAQHAPDIRAVVEELATSLERIRAADR